MTFLLWYYNIKTFKSGRLEGDKDKCYFIRVKGAGFYMQHSEEPFCVCTILMNLKAPAFNPLLFKGLPGGTMGKFRRKETLIPALLFILNYNSWEYEL